MRLTRDDVRVAWFAPGTCVIEQGEPAESLYLILNGTADALLEHPGGQVIHARRMQAGDFFGEIGLVAGRGTAHVVARESLTCLVLSRTPIRPYAGRGAGAGSAPSRQPPPCRRGPARSTSPATCTSSSARWRGTAPSTRLFRRCSPRTCCSKCSAPSSSAVPPAAAGTPPPAAGRRRRFPGGRRAARRRHTSGGIMPPALTHLIRSLLHAARRRVKRKLPSGGDARAQFVRSRGRSRALPA